MRFVLVVLCAAISVDLFGQSVSNVVAVSEFDKIIIKYDLRGEKDRTYSVKLFYSLDDKDFTTSPKIISGDIGGSEKIGDGKTIVWEVKKELIDFIGSVRFKIDASPVGSATNTTQSGVLKSNFFENENFKAEYVSSEKISGGFRIKAFIEAKSNSKLSFSRTSYAVDTANKIYNLSTALISGREVTGKKYEFLSGVRETLELTFNNRFVTEQAETIKGFSLTYSSGSSAIVINIE